MTVLEKAGSGSIEPEDFNRVVDELNTAGPPGTVTASDVDSQAAQDGDVLTADGAGGAAWVAGGGTRVIGPCSIEYADFNTDGDLLDLFDTTAGDVLVNAWYDPATAVNWDDSGVSRLYFAETPPGPTVHGNENWGFLPLDAIEPGGGPGSGDLGGTIATAAADHYISGIVTFVPQQTFVGGKLTVANNSGANDGAVGHVDLYFLVATPTAPVVTP